MAPCFVIVVTTMSSCVTTVRNLSCREGNQSAKADEGRKQNIERLEKYLSKLRIGSKAN
jgi:hypothetical protein